MLQARAVTAPQFKVQDLHGLSPAALAEVAAQMLVQINAQSQQIAAQSQQIAERDRAIKFKDAKLERITFELARLKAWKFAARTEAIRGDAGRRRGKPASAARSAAVAGGPIDTGASRAAPPAQTASAARAPGARRSPPRAGEHHLPDGRLRPADAARGRGRE